MDTTTIATAMLATLLLMATMFIQPVAANEAEPPMREITAPAQLATPDGWVPPQENENPEEPATDIVMSGGGPGATSTGFQFHLENVNED